MSKIAVPSWMMHLEREDKKETLLKYQPVKEHLIAALEKKLQDTEDQEAKTPWMSWINGKWNRVRFSTRKETIREIIKLL